jgi:REP element-mobilizing transposase RayT
MPARPQPPTTPLPSWLVALDGTRNRFDPETLRRTRGANLPWWTCLGAIYHVVFRLADAFPEEIRLRLIEARDLYLHRLAIDGRLVSPDERERVLHLHSESIARCLDAGHGSCVLRRPQLAQLVSDALKFHDGVRYDLIAWCVMPNHVHVIVAPANGHDLARIVRTWKSYTARSINSELNQSGTLWLHDTYTHIIRSEAELLRQVRYVLANPGRNTVIPRWVRSSPLR